MKEALFHLYKQNTLPASKTFCIFPCAQLSEIKKLPCSMNQKDSLCNHYMLAPCTMFNIQNKQTKH